MVSTDSYSVIKDVERYARRIQFQSNGVALDKGDQTLLQSALTMQYLVGLDLHLDGVIMSRSYIPFLQRNRDLDVISFGRFLKKVDGIIKDYTENFPSERIRDYKHFKHACGSDRSYWDFIGPIKDTIIQYLKEPTASTFRIINQWLNFIQRCNCRSLDLITELSEKYLNKETEMSQWKYDPTTVLELREIIDEWLKPFSLQFFLPVHGPGSIAGKKGRPVVGEKYLRMGSDIRLDFIKKYVGPLQTFSPFPFGSLLRESELVFVPKSLITQRTISKEPASLQYFQQGVRECLTDCFRKSDLGRHVALDHQEFSQQLARYGSVSGKYATIDLSDASDSVTKTLVKAVVKNPVVRNLLFATRSDSTFISQIGQRCQLEKFAPMGSSVCFPVETMIFAACCELAVRRLGNRKLYYRVYGDDIIIDRRAVQYLFEILDACHFSVNFTKSYWKGETHFFREACGGEYFDNIDVSPLRIPRKLVMPDVINASNPNVLEGYISLANNAFEFGYPLLRSYVLESIRRRNEKYFLSLPYSIDGRTGLRTYEDCCTNYRCTRRFNRALFRREAKCLDLVASVDIHRQRKIEVAALDEAIRYFEWLRMSSRRGEGYEPSPDTIISPEIRPMRIKVRIKWIPIT